MNNAVPLLHDYLIDSARRLPDKVALVCQQQRLTYAEIDARSNALAHALVRRGVARGDRIVVFADNTVETVVSFLGALKANAVITIVNPLTKADKLAYLLGDLSRGRPHQRWSHHIRLRRRGRAIASSQDRHHFQETSTKAARTTCPASSPERGRANRVARGPARSAHIDVDLAAIVYTSGSTGDPKGVMLTHRNMLTAATSITAYLENVEDDVILSVLPMSFDYSLYQMIMAFRMGARLVLERSFTYPAQVLKVLVDEGVTGFPGVPRFSPSWPR